MDALLQALLLIFVAELGDKSQVVALAYAARYSWKTTLLGIAGATALLQLLSVVVGRALGTFLPLEWIQVAAGVAFVVFGLWTLRGEGNEDGEEVKVATRFGPLLTIMSTFFLSEMGDKTMLATMTLSSQIQAPVQVWLGATLGMVGADALAIGVGQAMGARLPERAIRLVAAGIFLVFGIWTLLEAFGVLGGV